MYRSKERKKNNILEGMRVGEIELYLLFGLLSSWSCRWRVASAAPIPFDPLMDWAPQWWAAQGLDDQDWEVDVLVMLGLALPQHRSLKQYTNLK